MLSTGSLSFVSQPISVLRVGGDVVQGMSEHLAGKVKARED
jgi:hypothetical protein